MTPRKKPTIYGPDGKPLVRVNDRLAPKSRVGAGLEGWVSWGLIDRTDREVAGGEQHNLILNTFLERVAVVPLHTLPLFLSHFAVGTGSGAPNVTDTALDNELARTTTLITSETNKTGPGAYELVLEREFDFGAGNGNLTEFGFAGGASSDMLVRELFRDGGGNPITVTKTSDYKLRIKYVLTVALSPVIATPVSFVITGIGTINGEYSLISGGSGSPGDLHIFSQVATGSVGIGNNAIQVVRGPNVALSYDANVGSVSGTGSLSSISASTYVSGTHNRKITEALYGTAIQNAEWPSIMVAWAANTAGQRQEGFLWVIDQGDRFTKDNLHTLTLENPISVSWART